MCSLRHRALPTHQLPPAIASIIANPRLPAPFRRNDWARHRRPGRGADGGLADNRSIDDVVAQWLHLPVDALAGAGRVRGGAADQQKRESDKNRGHADLVTNLACVGRISQG